MSQYVDKALAYARGVVAGEIVACALVRQACQRQLDDLARWEKDGPYRFDVAAAHRFCAFAEALPHVKGEWAKRGDTITLEPWQCFIYTTKYGWLRREDGLRRFRTSYLEIARKNAKTTVAAAEALYLELEDGEPGAEVYFAAVDRKQAQIGWSIAKQMVQKSPDMREHYGVQAMAHAIVARDSASTCQALSRDAGSLEGLNVHGGIVDELHAHKTREVFDVIDSATGSRSQPLISSITTAGSDRSGICFEQRTYVVKILSGAIKDETYFGIIYTIDDGDDWSDEANWPKANPNLGVSVYLDDLRAKAAKARETPSALANFLTKRLNVWVNADHGLFDVLAWEKCADTTLKIEDFAGKYPCWIGIDLAMRDDFCAEATLFDVDGEYRLFMRFWLPEETVEQSNNSQYDGWARAGLLEATEGDVVDFDLLESTMEERARQVGAKAVAYDPWSATQTAVHLHSRGVPMIETPQNLRTLSEPTKTFAAMMNPKRLKHDGNPVMTWMISNVVGRYDSSENVKPKKAHEDQKIDGPMAAIFALAAQLRAAQAPQPTADSFSFV